MSIILGVLPSLADFFPKLYLFWSGWRTYLHFSVLIGLLTSVTTVANCQSYFDSLPDDLFVEILQRLPQKYVHRYRCVSQRWLNITSTCSFIKSYVEYNTCSPRYRPPFILFYQYISDQYLYRSSYGIPRCAFSEHPHFKSTGNPLDFLRPSSVNEYDKINILSSSIIKSSGNPLAFLRTSLVNEYDKINILSSSNGLMLCSLDRIHRYWFYICNPLTKHWIKIRPPPNDQYSYTGFVCKSTYNGCSFRIVQFSLQERNGPYVRLDIYNSESESWTISNFENFKENIKFSLGTAAIECNGLLHFKNERSSIFVYDPYTGTDDGRIIKVPNQSSISWQSSTIGACNGHIRYIHWVTDTHWGSDSVRVWELDDYETEKWKFVQEFRLNKMENEDPDNFIDALYTVEFHPTNENVIFLRLQYRIVLCDMLSKKLTTVCKLRSREELFMFPFALPCWPDSL